MLSLLIENGADINAKANDGWTALMEAAYEGHIETIKFLIEKGADINPKTEDGKTAADLANEKGHKHIAAWLKENPGTKI